MRSMVARACALLCLVGLAAFVGSPEDVRSAGGQPASSDRSTTRWLEPARGPARGSSSGAGAPGSAVSGSEGPASPRATEPYEGLGTWIDIYDTDVWEHPVPSVRSMAAHGIRTIYLQSSNYHRSRPFVHPEGVGAIVDAAHRRGLDGGGVVPAGLPRPPARPAPGRPDDPVRDRQRQRVRLVRARHRVAGGSPAEPPHGAAAPHVGGHPACRGRRVSARRDHGLARPPGPDRSPLLAGLPVAPARRDLRRVPADDVLHVPGQGAAGRGLVHGAERADHPPADPRAERPDPRRRRDLVRRHRTRDARGSCTPSSSGT